MLAPAQNSAYAHRSSQWITLDPFLYPDMIGILMSGYLPKVYNVTNFLLSLKPNLIRVGRNIIGVDLHLIIVIYHSI